VIAFLPSSTNKKQQLGMLKCKLMVLWKGRKQTMCDFAPIMNLYDSKYKNVGRSPNFTMDNPTD
jgi:hypothetical protein